MSSKIEFHRSFPGYISSRDEPRMDTSRLDDICEQIQRASGISVAHNFPYDGVESGQNFFALLTQGLFRTIKSLTTSYAYF